MHFEDPAKTAREFHRMGDHDERDAFIAIHLDKQVSKVLGRCAIEGSGRFIGEEQPRLIDQRANYRNALSFTARELARALQLARPEADTLKQTFGARVRLIVPVLSPRRRVLA